MIKNESEIWKALPGVPGIEISTFGNVRVLDRVISSENGTRFTKGRILKQYDNRGYLVANILVDGKWTTKRVHRLAAQTFIPNPDNLLEVNHKNCNRADNRVSNLEWCSHSYNQKYREKYGVSQTEVVGHPVFAINLTTLEVSRFLSQNKASIALGVSQGNISDVIKGRYKQACGFWFTKDDGKATDVIKHKLQYIKDLHVKQNRGVKF